LWIAIGDQELLTLPKKAEYSTRITYPMTDSVEGRRVRAIVEDSKGRVWLGTRDGLYMKSASVADFCSVPIIEGKMVSVFCLYLDKKECLWVGTDRGVFRLLLDKQQLKSELVDSTITNIGKIVADKNRLWIATEKGLYCRKNDNTTEWYQEAAHAIVTDARGQVWVGTDNGIARITEKGVQPFSTVSDGHIVKNLLCWRDFLWCSHEQGLCCVNIYTGQSTIIQTEHNEYLDGSASLDSTTGTLYFGGTLGIDCLQADSLDEKLRSGVAQLWLEEMQQTVSPQPEDSSPTIWYYWILAALIAVGSAAIAYYLLKKAKATIVEETPLGPKPDSMFIQKARSITEAHMGDADFTAEKMAQEMAMSRSKLFLLMKKETGKAVMEFVRDIRLDYAAQQLAAGVPVADITMACGFSDPSSFRRSFVRKFGINPSQYREKMRQT
jgi:AraC-like DNA-binding protein